MSQTRDVLLDNEYTIMAEITDNENVTQRELSHKLGISVSTVNTLMKKMVREGLVKMNQVSQKQVLYMLTPVGMVAKANKTVGYLKHHYRAIFETKERIKDVLKDLSGKYDIIYVLIGEDEMGEIVRNAVGEVDGCDKRVQFINQTVDIDKNRVLKGVILHLLLEGSELEYIDKISGIDVVNLSGCL